MSKLVTLTIDGQKVEAPEGALIVNAAKKVGIDIPVFCYHPKMEPVGMCRMCLVEIGRPFKDRLTNDWARDPDGSLKIQFGPKLETACTTPVSEGMVVVGNSEKAKAGRKDILEFLLTSHPLDCPICDKGGECPLQNLTMGFGPGESRFIYDEKYHLAKHVPLGELILLDRERCIQCARCVRFQEKVAGEPVIGFFQRGRALEIVTFSEPGFDSVFSGNTTDICPVGALTTVDFRFEARPWEMNAAASICNHCPVGCNITLNVRREARAEGKKVIKRVMPRQNESVNEIWICDKGRFAYHYTQTPDRLSEPLLRKNGELVPVSWEEALAAAAAGFKAADKDLLVLAGGRLANEDLFNLQQLASGLEARSALYSSMAGGDLVAKAGVGKGTNIADMGPGTVILVVASDLQEEAPIWWLRLRQAVERGATLVVANPRPTRTDAFASHRLRYAYGAEAATVLSMVNALSAKRPDLGESAPRTGDREISEIAEIFAKAENAVIFYGSEGLGLEGSQALAQACANLLVATGHVGRPNNGLVAVWPVGNHQGAWDMGLRPLPDWKAAFESAKALYLAGVDPLGDDPPLAEAAKATGFLVVQELFLTETARQADVVLPAQAYTEREGTYTSGERRVQRFYPALPVRPQCEPDFAITAQIGELLGLDMESRAASLVFDRLAAQAEGYAGLNYQKLAEFTEQVPIVGRQDVYYGGTTYNNTQGLGVQLEPAAQLGESVPLGWIQPQGDLSAGDGLLAVPVTRLYDRGQTVSHSLVLNVRIPQPLITLHPADASRYGIGEGDCVALNVGEAELSAGIVAHLDESVPSGILLVPRSMGVPIQGPVQVKIEVRK